MVAVEVLEEEVVVVMVLSIKPRTSSMLGRNSTIDRHSQPHAETFLRKPNATSKLNKIDPVCKAPMLTGTESIASLKLING